jgi:cysteine synthase A
VLTASPHYRVRYPQRRLTNGVTVDNDGKPVLKSIIMVTEPTAALEVAMTQDRAWLDSAIGIIERDFNRSADTHLIKVDLPSVHQIALYLKDESIHPTGSLKHRLARSLFLYALVNGWISAGTTIVEASSGSTAVSEAYFARLLGLPFLAVVPRATSAEKIDAIHFYGGQCHFVDDPRSVRATAQRLADDLDGHFMDQFTFAERATDWRGNNNIAESIFQQMSREEHPVPRWIVVGAGTGGTSATVGRYVRYRKLATQVCVVDPENSVFADFYGTRNRTLSIDASSRIEGIGRPTVEPSFMPDVIDRVLRVPDVASLAAMRFFSTLLGRKCGGSTGTGLWGCIELLNEMQRTAQSGSIVTLLCDSGERYLQTYFNDEWLMRQGLDLAPQLQRLDRFFTTGEWP